MPIIYIVFKEHNETYGKNDNSVSKSSTKFRQIGENVVGITVQNVQVKLKGNISNLFKTTSDSLSMQCTKVNATNINLLLWSIFCHKCHQ